MDDLVRATARKVGVEPKTLFYQACRERGLSDVKGQAEYRYLMWFKYGEMTPIIENHCLNQWRPHAGERPLISAAIP